jgi:hypothetical protein
MFLALVEEVNSKHNFSLIVQFFYYWQYLFKLDRRFFTEKSQLSSYATITVSQCHALKNP